MLPDIIRHRVPTGIEFICNLGRCHPTSEIIVTYPFSDINFYEIVLKAFGPVLSRPVTREGGSKSSIKPPKCIYKYEMTTKKAKHVAEVMAGIKRKASVVLCTEAESSGSAVCKHYGYFKQL